MGFDVSPATLQMSYTGCSFSTSEGDVNLPVYLDAAGSSSVLLPLHRLKFSAVTFDGSHACIGRYNGDGLDPANACLPDLQTPQFIDDGQVTAFIGLAEADQVVVGPLQESLCVLLSGDAATYGDGAKPIGHCKKDANGKLLFAGDWCSATNSPASGGCADAVRFAATFAASGVQMF